MQNIDQYYYHLPSELIAKQPASPRDSSRLFVYDTKTNEIFFDYFYHLHTYIPQDSIMVLNKTKVLPARVEMKKSGGGKVKALFLVNELHKSSNTAWYSIRVFVDRKVQIGERLFFNKDHYVTVISQQEHIFTVQYDFSPQTLFSLLEKKGVMPIPLYIKNSPLDRSQLRKKYQTVFARAPVGARLIGGSAAAPTASLHFTNRLFNKLEKKGIQKEFVTLHVGMGTFAPVTDEQFKQKKLHEEWYEVEGEVTRKIDKWKIEGRELIAVGTTVVRTLESLTNLSLRESRFAGDEAISLGLPRPFGARNDIISQTDLFIYPPYDFKVVDHMITNFHLPGSSLMMLVEAFLQNKKAKRSLVDLYQTAIKENFRFYSFGDGMLIM